MLSAAAAALAAGGRPITEKVLGAASISQRYTVNVTSPTDVVVAEASVPPGSSFGWHYHRAAVAVVVKSGRLTLYDSADRTCTPRRYSTAQGLVEHKNHIHLARNEGPKPVVALVIYLSLKHGVNPDVAAASPGNRPSRHSGRELLS